MNVRKMTIGEFVSCIAATTIHAPSVMPVDSVCGKCTKRYAVMKLAKWKRNVVCKVKIEEDDQTKQATIFANVLTKPCDCIADGDIVKMLLPSQFISICDRICENPACRENA